MKKILISHIQRFSLNDGPGIRTTVFLMGCSIHCPWCANPENLQMKQCHYKDKYHVESVYGVYYTVDELLHKLLKDQIFFAGEGGITFSGGEALLQSDSLLPVWKKLRYSGINLCLETALFVPSEQVDLSMQYINEYIVDIKVLDGRHCRNLLGGDVSLYLRNVEHLFRKGKKVMFRFPLVANETVSDKNIDLVIKLLMKYKPYKVQIFPIHSLGREKYKYLGKPFYEYPQVESQTIDEIKRRIQALGILCEHIKIS